MLRLKIKLQSLAIKLDKTLFKNSVIYIISEFSVKAIPLFLIPLLTSKLTKAEYGIVVNFQVIAYFLNIAVAAGTYTAFWPMLNDKKNAAAKILSNFAVIPFLIGIMLCICTFLFISGSFLEVPRAFILLGITVAIGEYFVTLLSFLWLFQNKAAFNALFKICRALFELGLILLIFHLWGTTWQNRIIIISLSTLTFFTIAAIYFLKQRLIKFDANRTTLKNIFAKSIPAVPYELTLPVRQIFERWFILIFLGSVFNGTYGLAVQLTTPIHLLCVALFNALLPYIYKYKNENTVEGNAGLRKMIFLYIGAVVAFSAVYIAALPYAFEHIIDKKYGDSFLIAVLLLAAVVIKNVYGLFTQFIIYQSRTKLLSLISTVSFVITIFCIFLAAKYTDIKGVACAVIIAETITLIIILFAVRNISGKLMTKEAEPIFVTDLEF